MMEERVKQLEMKVAELERRIADMGNFDSDFQKNKIIRRDITFKGKVVFNGEVWDNNLKIHN